MLCKFTLFPSKKCNSRHFFKGKNANYYTFPKETAISIQNSDTLFMYKAHKVQNTELAINRLSR